VVEEHDGVTCAPRSAPNVSRRSAAWAIAWS